jgi:hypothetical protein
MNESHETIITIPSFFTIFFHSPLTSVSTSQTVLLVCNHYIITHLSHYLSRFMTRVKMNLFFASSFILLHMMYYNITVNSKQKKNIIRRYLQNIQYTFYRSHNHIDTFFLITSKKIENTKVMLNTMQGRRNLKIKMIVFDKDGKF